MINIRTLRSDTRNFDIYLKQNFRNYIEAILYRLEQVLHREIYH